LKLLARDARGDRWWWPNHKLGRDGDAPSSLAFARNRVGIAESLCTAIINGLLKQNLPQLVATIQRSSVQMLGSAQKCRSARFVLRRHEREQLG
jgi:hypothetical protein